MKRFFLMVFAVFMPLFMLVSDQDEEGDESGLESVFINENHIECQKFCGTEPDCELCRKSTFCGPKFRRMKLFNGKGRNYSACTPVKSDNLEECQQFCKDDYRCSFCWPTFNCGVGFVNVKSFRGKGTNWYACEKIRSINLVWPKKLRIKPEHRYLVVSVGGYGGIFGHDGIEWFCDKHLTPEVAPEALCINSYGRPRTATWLLAENIKNTVLLMEQVTGVKPKVIMLGKSMGGCKLHHAIAEDKGGKVTGLGALDVELFIGVDMSCQVKRHFEDPADILEFNRNIKELWNFYQLHPTTTQTGHRAHFTGEPFDENIHIDANNEGFDTSTMTKIPAASPEQVLCEDASHLNIDNCPKLLDTILEMVLKKMRSN